MLTTVKSAISIIQRNQLIVTVGVRALTYWEGGCMWGGIKAVVVANGTTMRLQGFAGLVTVLGESKNKKWNDNSKVNVHSSVLILCILFRHQLMAIVNLQ